jgi:NAD(P)-dependent dehydrogenase (short-subunit alcohol dehydrogenase family)
MAKWTADDMPSLAGRVAIVTGANSGLGYETARALAGHGATVIMACRSTERGAAALAQIRSSVLDPDASVRPLDLAYLSSVRSFVDDFDGGLDILVNNAGVMAIPRRETADGFEMQFGTNHLGHFALTGLLMPALLQRPGARVVTVSSQAANIGRLNFDDLQGARHYTRWTAYGQAKLANQVFCLELDRRARAAGVDLVSAAAHPGYAATNLQTAAGGFWERLMGLGNAMVAQSAAAGALPTLYAASAPGIQGGTYYGPDQIGGMRGHPRQVKFVRQARSEEAGRRLWEMSEQLTGVSVDALLLAHRRPGEKLQGRCFIPLMKLDRSRSGSALARMSGTRCSSSRHITVISRRARCAPRQKWGPGPPNPT